MAPETAPGRVIGGRYRLVEELASGGFGRVWRAVDESLRVEVAVKEVRLPPASSPAEHGKRLAYAVREARNAARLRDHPHIVAVHDVVVEEETPWTVMRLVDGHSLEQRLTMDGPLSAQQVADMATALLKALGAAHSAGIVHRDVKPANVMLTADGEVLLTDFGISVHQADTALTTTGSVIGSIEYMAPERLNGIDDPSGDLFSLGATLYQAVEGVSPFRRDTPTATLAALALHEAPPPRCAAGLAGLITALLAKEPRQRPSVTAALHMLRDEKPEAVPDTRPLPAPTEPSASTRRAETEDTRDVGARPAKLTITSRDCGVSLLRVLVNGSEVGTLGPQNTNTFAITPGKSLVEVTSRNHRSQPEKVDLLPSRSAHFVVSQRSGRLKLTATGPVRTGVGYLLSGLLFAAGSFGLAAAGTFGEVDTSTGFEGRIPFVDALVPGAMMAIFAALAACSLWLSLFGIIPAIQILSGERWLQRDPGWLAPALIVYGIALFLLWLPRVY